MKTYSPVKHQEKNYSIPTNSTPKHHAQSIGDIPVNSFNLHKTVKLSPVGNEYMCFQIDGKYYHSSKCVKSRIMTKVIVYVLFINTFEQQFVVVDVVVCLGTVTWGVYKS